MTGGVVKTIRRNRGRRERASASGPAPAPPPDGASADGASADGASARARPFPLRRPDLAPALPAIRTPPAGGAQNPRELWAGRVASRLLHGCQVERGDLEAQALYEIGKLLSLASHLATALTSSLTLLRLYVGLERGTISLFDPLTRELFIEAAPELDDAERIRGRVPAGEGPVGRVFRAGMPAVIPCDGERPEGGCPERRGGAASGSGSGSGSSAGGGARILVPIRDGRVTYGVLAADRPAAPPAGFDRDLRLLSTVAGMVAVRVRLLRLESPHRHPEDDAPAIIPDPERFPAVVAASAPMRDALALVERVAQSRATVLVRGESGTGKELIARAIHDASPRASRPFVAVSCAALSDALVESELFGHERGAFTGATAERPGRFELADGGTLFLDEVGEIPHATQVKLLRVLQERQFERVGGRRTLTVDVRIVAATNRDMEEAVQRGAFRLDLYHRLSVVTVSLPPLRARAEDVPLLAARFLAELSREYGRTLELAPGAVERLLACGWSGNVRQLRNCLERAAVSSGRTRLGPADVCPGKEACALEQVGAVRPVLAVTVPGPVAVAPVAARPPVPGPDAPDAGFAPAPAPAEARDERERVRRALERSGFVQAKAARLLGLTPRQLAYRVRKFGIVLDRF